MDFITIVNDAEEEVRFFYKVIRDPPPKPRPPKRKKKVYTVFVEDDTGRQTPFTFEFKNNVDAHNLQLRPTTFKKLNYSMKDMYRMSTGTLDRSRPLWVEDIHHRHPPPNIGPD